MKKTEITISREEHNPLNAVHCHNDLNETGKNRPLVILCHGFTGDKFEWGRFPKAAQSFCDAGYDTIYFDFSGSGKNKREPVLLSSQIVDLMDVHKWAQDQGYGDFVTVGLSFGGLTSIIPHLENRKCAVYWAPAFHMVDVIGRRKLKLAKFRFSFNKSPIKLKSGDNDPILINNEYFEEIKRLDVDSILMHITVPSLIIQGKEDKTVKPEWNRNAYNEMIHDDHHKYIEIDNADHNFAGVELDQFIEHSIKFIKKHL